MIDTFAAVLDIAIVVFAVSSMLSVGLGHTLAEIISPLGRVRNIVRALMANFVLAPALALLILRIMPLDGPLEVGLILIAVAAGAPFVVKLSETAGADLSLTAALLILLLPVTILLMPLAVPLLLPGIDVQAGAVASPLVATMLIPLGVGLLVRGLWARGALRLRPVMSNLSTIALIVLVLSTLIANFGEIVGIGWKALVAAALFIAGAFALGYLIGGRNIGNREVLGLATGQRNVAAATVIASQVVGNPDTVSMVVVSSMVGLAILFPTARMLYRNESSRNEQA